MTEYERRVRENGAKIAAYLRKVADAVESCQYGVTMQFVADEPDFVTISDLVGDGRTSAEVRTGTLTVTLRSGA
jgi:hypothetical protein